MALVSWSAPVFEDASFANTSSNAGTAVAVADFVCVSLTPTRPPSLPRTSVDNWLEIRSTMFMVRLQKERESRETECL